MTRSRLAALAGGLGVLALAAAAVDEAAPPKPEGGELEVATPESEKDIVDFFLHASTPTRDVAAPPPKTRSAETVIGGRRERQTIVYDRTAAFRIQFDGGSARIRPDSEPALQRMAGALSDPRIAEDRFFVNGHASSEGSAEANLKLSQKRAEAVRDRLVALGAPNPGRLIARGFGERIPLASNGTPEGREKNRRVELEIQKWTPGASRR